MILLIVDVDLFHTRNKPSSSMFSSNKLSDVLNAISGRSVLMLVKNSISKSCVGSISRIKPGPCHPSPVPYESTKMPFKSESKLPCSKFGSLDHSSIVSPVSSNISVFSSTNFSSTSDGVPIKLYYASSSAPLYIMAKVVFFFHVYLTLDLSG